MDEENIPKTSLLQEIIETVLTFVIVGAIIFGLGKYLI